MACSALRTLRSRASWVIITTDTVAPWACPRPFCSTDSMLMACSPRMPAIVAKTRGWSTT